VYQQRREKADTSLCIASLKLERNAKSARSYQLLEKSMTAGGFFKQLLSLYLPEITRI